MTVIKDVRSPAEIYDAQFVPEEKDPKALTCSRRRGGARVHSRAAAWERSEVGDAQAHADRRKFHVDGRPCRHLRRTSRADEGVSQSGGRPR